MTLFKFELRKLLLNKRNAIIMAVLLVSYCAIGVGMSVFSFGSIDNYNTYSAMANAAAGPYNEEQAQISNAAYDAALDRYGNADGIAHIAMEDPQLKFDVAYHDYSTTVDEYWNGPETQDLANLKGIYPIQDRMAVLEADGATDSYEYRSFLINWKPNWRLGSQSSIMWHCGIA